MYALILYIIPENPYLAAGVWMIILHSLQLFVAKIQKKGETTQIAHILVTVAAFSWIVDTSLPSIVLFGEYPYPSEENE